MPPSIALHTTNKKVWKFIKYFNKLRNGLNEETQEALTEKKQEE